MPRNKATPREPMPPKQGPEPQTDTPLDLSDAAVKKLFRNAKKRGYVTHDRINSVLPSEEVNSEQIEDVLSALSEMAVNVVEAGQAKQDEAPRRRRRGSPKPVDARAGTN